MAVALRLSRQGSKKRPFYRLVAADKRNPRDGRFLELLGTYNPKTKNLDCKFDRYDHWISCGAQPSRTFSDLVRKNRAPAPASTAAAEE